MKAGRFLRWQEAKKKLAWINMHLAAGRMVQIATYTKAWRYTAKNAPTLKATRTGLYIARGKSWDCIDGCDIRAFA